MERYCIIAPGRSGTSVVVNGIEHYFYKKYNYFMAFGEINAIKNCQINIYKNKIKSSQRNDLTHSYGTPEYDKNSSVIVNYIKHTTLPVVGKFIPHLWQTKNFNVIEYPKFFIDNGFEIIIIKRNFIDIFISTIVAQSTKIYHTLKNENKVNTLPIKINLELALEMLQSCQASVFLTKQIAKTYPCKVFEYNNISEELKNNFSITDEDLKTTTTYPIPYSDIISNYNEVLNWVEEYKFE